MSKNGGKKRKVNSPLARQLPDGNILIIVDSDTRLLRMRLSCAKWPGIGQQDKGTNAAANLQEMIGSIRSVSLVDTADCDPKLLPDYRNEHPEVEYGPLVFLIYLLGREFNLNTGDIPKRIFVVTTETLKAAFDKGEEEGDRCLRECFKRLHLLPYVALYGGGAADAYLTHWMSIQQACIGYYTAGISHIVKTLPPLDVVFLRTFKLPIQACVLSEMQKIFGLNAKGLNARSKFFGSHYVKVADLSRSSVLTSTTNNWMCIVSKCDAVWEYLHEKYQELSGDDRTSQKQDASPFVFEVIVSLWDMGLLKHVALAVTIGLGAKEKDDECGIKLSKEQGGRRQFETGADDTINVVISVKTVLSSGSVNTDATRASVPKGTSALLLHLFPHDESDQQFTFAHVTFIGRKNENNRKPQILDAKVDGMAFSPRNPDDMPRFEKVMHCLKTEVPQVLVTRCTSAFPTHVEDLHKSHYVVDATFRVVAMADENRHEVLPIAIGEAPFVIPRPHESDNVLHVEIARTMASMIDRGGQL